MRIAERSGAAALSRSVTRHFRYILFALSWTSFGAQSRCRCGSGEPSPGADVAAASPVPVSMWER